MSTDLAIAPSASALRRRLASAVASSYGYLLFVAWFNPLLILSTRTHDGSQQLLWIALGVSAIFYFFSLMLIPRRYYNLQPFERDGRLYRRLGVKRFRYIVGEGEGIQRLARLIDPHWQAPLAKKTYDERMRWTITPEWVHLGMLFLSLPLIALAYYRGFTGLATFYLVSNIPFNIYPVLLQRYTRGKLLRICQRQSAQARLNPSP
jgi:hypothetical protein